MRPRTPFANRTDAGHVLARSLEPWRHTRPLILGIPRGGIIVAEAIASVLGAELDAVIVRKVGSPNQPELAIGAVTPEGHVLLDRDLIDRIGIRETELNELIAAEQLEAQRRLASYRHGRPVLDVRERVVILVDDGLATGATMAVALQLVRKQNPARVIAAAPVGSPFAIDAVRPLADAVVCPLVPDALVAVGAYYDDFSAVDDETVRKVMAGTTDER